jgi:ribose-phosphate pyrophosphokinase
MAKAIDPDPLDPEGIRLFGLEGSRPLAEAVGAHLGLALAEHEERDFDDGEHKARPLTSVRDRDVYVLHSLHGEPGASPNDKLCRLLFFLGAVRDAGARRVTAVAPYLCYSRKDRRTKSRDPVTTRYVAALFEAVGVDSVVTVDVHNLQAFQNAFRCRTEHLEAKGLFARHMVGLLSGEEVAVVSPDLGGAKRAGAFRERLERDLGRPVSSAFAEKKRSGGVVSGELLAGDVSGRVAVVLDDMIGSGTTMKRAAVACRAAGAREVYAVATHGLFLSGASEVVADPSLTGVVVTDTVPPFRLVDEAVRRKVTVLPAAPLLAEAIRRLHTGGSLIELMES